MAIDEYEALVNGPPHETVLEELKNSYNRTWDRKDSLEQKASNNVTVSGIVIPLLFGFVAFIIPPSNGVNNLISITAIILVSIILNVVSIVFSVIGYGIQKYEYVFSSDDSTKLDSYTSPDTRKIDVINTLISHYHNALVNNSKQNNGKVKWIVIAQWFMLVGLALIPIPIIIILSELCKCGSILSILQ